MLINKDPATEIQVRLLFRDNAAGKERNFRDTAELYQFSSAQYEWHEDGEHGHPRRTNPPVRSLWRTNDGCCLRLPPYSVSVVRGRLTE